MLAQLCQCFLFAQVYLLGAHKCACVGQCAEISPLKPVANCNL